MRTKEEITKHTKKQKTGFYTTLTHILNYENDFVKNV
jgi:hypothetical protein